MKKYLGLAFTLILGACAPGSYIPPVSISAGFFGAQVTVAEPGFTVPAKVVKVPDVTSPTLIVPFGATPKDSVPVVNSTGKATSVQVVEAPVDKPVLAVPVK